jgi:hypothetical protein
LDWNAAIEKNRKALKRVLAMLVAMAGLGSRGQFTFFPQDGAPPQGLALAEKSKLSPAPALPRRLHRAVLALLRPAEAAARRLVIVTARSLVAALPPPGTPEAGSVAARKAGGACIPPASLPRRARSLPLFDRLRPFQPPPLPVAGGMPRISVPGYGVPFPIAMRRPCSPDDPVDAARLALRLEALGRALDDLPRQARRFARWRAARDAAGARHGGTRRPFRRVWPLRPGRPPGWRRRPVHEVHEILDVVHGLALWALERPRDTS